MYRHNCTVLLGVTALLILWQPAYAGVHQKNSTLSPNKKHYNEKQNALKSKQSEETKQKELLSKKHKNLTFNETLELLRLRR